CQQCSTVSYSF
nr:immunoglobulin light chain junction region [Macaca mulatta]